MKFGASIGKFLFFNGRRVRIETPVEDGFRDFGPIIGIEPPMENGLRKVIVFHPDHSAVISE